ncbi:MAG: UDP-N-acetylmuramoyl-tripeptide--D-alanyl-D-alanine ligase [Gammaproteobacteria bacterium]
MINGRLQQLATLLRAELTGDDGAFLGVSTDTRKLEAGQLFVALRGPRFDGHKFLGEAADRGAAAALVSTASEVAIPQVRVPDTLRALAELAADWRRRFDIPVIGITGSYGKTTVKEILASILSRRGPLLVTKGNLNNEIGVPLTLFGLAGNHQSAVIEMGANHAGEIARLCAIAAPQVSLVTTAGACHLEGFGSLEGVARAKGEIFEALPADGIAVINADDSYAALWRQLAAGRQVVTFGLGPGSEFTARNVRQTGAGEISFVLVTPAGEADVRLGLAGRHNVMNALAAAAAAAQIGAGLEHMVDGFGAVAPVSGRMQLLRSCAGGRLIDDSYNASPRAVRAAIEYLCELPGRAWAVLGDMGELGDEGPRLHAEVGRYAREAGVERLFAIGRLSEETVAAFGAGAQLFHDAASLGAAVREGLGPDVNVLVKGSRMMRMERVVEALAESAAVMAEGEC